VEITTLFDHATIPEVTEESITPVLASVKSIDEKRAHGMALLNDAQKYLNEGATDSAQRMFAHSKRLLSDVEANTQLVASMSDYRQGLHLPVNELPVVSGEAEGVENDTGARLRASHKPVGWIKGFPAAAQPKWVREKMGSTQKEESEVYKEAFSRWMLDKSPGALSFFATGDPNHIRAMEEGTDSEGGFLVPEDWRDELIHDVGVPGSVHRPHTTVVKTGRDAGNFPTIASVTWASIVEEAAITGAESTPTVGQVTFAITKSGGIVKTSMELLEDNAHNLPAVLTQLFNEAKGRWEDTQIIGGDGTTEPEGIRTDGATDVVMDGDDVLIIADLHEWFWALPSQFKANGRFSTTSIFMQHALALNSGSHGQHLITDLTQAPAERLLGKPISIFDDTGWDNATTIAANEELGVFGDFRHYYLIDRVGISIRRLNELYAGTDQVGFFARARGDGKVGLSNAFRILKAKAS
jgi:HK97 family phage major capsid protein